MKSTDSPPVAHRQWRRLIGPLLLAGILFFLVLYLKSIDFHRLSQLRISWGWLAAASLLALAYRYWAVMVWRVILRSLGSRELPPYEVMSHVFAKAWMARYIPGTVTWVAGRIYLASQYGISVSRLTVSSLLEGGMQIVAGIVVSLLLIGLGGQVSAISLPVKVFAVAAGLASLIVLLPPVFNRILRRAYRLVKRQQPSDELRVNSQAVIRSFLLFALGTIIAGSANFLVAKSIVPHLGGGRYFYLVGTFGLAGAIGIATPFLPSGIGVRDGIQLVLLSLIFPKEIALAITVLSRLWSVAVDVLFFGMATAIHRLWRRRSTASPVGD